MSDRPLRLGTRGSHLAVVQSGHVAAAVTSATGREVELVIIKTTGDRVQDRPLAQVGGKGLFTKEIEDALLSGAVDFAVHSMKDMPAEMPPGLVFGAVPKRVDPRDALVGSTLTDLPRGARVGTGSARRGMQLLRLRPDLQILGIRGNVDTRIAKQRAGEFDAVVLAAAGMTRIGRLEEASELLSEEDVIPAVGQGALAVQCRGDDADTLAALARIHDEATAACVAAERAFLVALHGGCSVPAACHASWEGDQLRVTAMFAESADDLRRAVRVCPPSEGPRVGAELAAEVRGA